MESSSGETTPKRHSRQGSSSRGNIARRPTRGPLDIADSPLSPSPLSQTATTPSTPPANAPGLPNQGSLLSPTTSQYITPPNRSPRLPSPTPGSNLSHLTLSTDPSFRTARTSSKSPPPPLTKKDFSYLLVPSLYHPLTHLDIPPPFRSLSLQPSTSTSLEELLQRGQYRSAAIQAANILTTPGSCSPYDYNKIFSLIYIRLSCLTLCNQTALAAQEVKALEDLNSAFYREGDEGKGDHLVPWELRVLAVRLQGMGFNDARRGVMGYYDLARDARLILTTLKKELAVAETSTSSTSGAEIQQKIALWDSRLADLGIRVASALVEMEDFSGAATFLATLTSTSTTGDLAIQKALLYLCIGQVDAARSALSIDENDGKEKKVILALAYMADGEYESAIKAWEELISSASAPGASGVGEGNDALYKQNLAIAQLYQGDMAQAKTTLESLISPSDPNSNPNTPSNSHSHSYSFHALTFNLSTIYELCSEKSRGLKISLAEKVAGILEEELLILSNGSGSFGNGNGNGNRGVVMVRGAEKVNGDFKL